MLAFDDGALARLMIAATRLPARKRGRWLRQIAQLLDPPSEPERTRFEIKLNFVQMSRALVASGQLSANQAHDPNQVETAVTRMVNDWVERDTGPLADFLRPPSSAA